MGTTAEVQCVPMTEQEARATVKTIKADLDNASRLAIELKRRQGWKALGYNSWSECAKQEFDKSATRIYTLVQTEEVRSSFTLPNSVNEIIENISDGALEPLIPHRGAPEVIQEAISRAVANANGKSPTARQVKDAVDTVLAEEGFPVPAPKLNGALPGQTTFLGEQKETNEPEADPDLSAWEKWVDARFTFFASIDRRGGVVDYTKRWSESQRSQLAAILEHCIERMTSYLNDLKEIHS